MNSPASPATGSRRTADVDGHPTASSADDFMVHGKIAYDNGNRYEGGLKGGKKHGQGKYTWASGAVYDGGWADDERHGHGKMTHADGSVYRGDWEGDKRHGQGKFTYASGSVYEGYWVNGKRHGQGKYTWANGRVYGGLWEDDKMHGRGKHTWVNGDVYEGGWEDGKIHGQGKMTYANGDVYEGGWEEGKKHGQGTMTYANGRVHDGKWKKGKQSDIVERRVQELQQYCQIGFSLEGMQERIRGIPPDAVRGSDFFHWACRNESVTFEVIECLLDAFPDAARSIGEYEQSPLHFACWNKSLDPGIVRLLLACWPESVNHQDNRGDLPLHCLCDCSSVDETASLTILDLLLAAAPQSAAELESNGYHPIHVASESGKPFSFCKRLIDASPESLRVVTADGNLPIHLACASGNDVETVQCMLEMYPESVDARDSGGILPIHYTVLGEASGNHKTDIIRYLLTEDPDCASKTGNNQALPLHFACIQNCLESARLLFDAYPEALHRDGRNLLDIARQGPDGKAMVDFLDAQFAYARIAEDSRAVRTPDENGWLPLHDALLSNASLGAIKLLIAGNPSALQVPDNQSSFPLHVACEFSTVEVVHHILRLSDIHLHALDLWRDSPLHCACRYGNLSVVKYLLERHVPSVSEPNNASELPIQLLWESGRVDRNSVEYVEANWLLLLARPETVMHRSNDALI